MARPPRRCCICLGWFNPPPKKGIGNRFTVSTRKTCSDACKKELQRRTNSNPRKRWSEEEDRVLLELIGYYPIRVITSRYNQQASINGWRKRTLVAVQARAHKLGQSTLPMYDGWGSKELARLLQIPSSTITGWVRRGFINPPIARGRRVFRVRELKRLARQRPELFVSSDRDGLAYVIGNELAQMVREMFPDPIPRIATPLMRVSDGRIFPSMGAAAIATGCSRAALHYAVREGRPCRGVRWERVERRSA